MCYLFSVQSVTRPKRYLEMINFDSGQVLARKIRCLYTARKESRADENSEVGSWSQSLWPPLRHRGFGATSVTQPQAWRQCSFFYLWPKWSVIHFLLIFVYGVSCRWKFLIFVWYPFVPAPLLKRLSSLNWFCTFLKNQLFVFVGLFLESVTLIFLSILASTLSWLLQLYNKSWNQVVFAL